MYSGGLPFSVWQKNQHSIKLKKAEKAEIIEDISNFVDKNVSKLGKENNSISLLSEDYLSERISDLVFNHNTRTHDSILIATSIEGGCKYFVTGDKNLRSVSHRKVKIISPEEAIRLLD